LYRPASLNDSASSNGVADFDFAINAAIKLCMLWISLIMGVFTFDHDEPSLVEREASL